MSTNEDQRNAIERTIIAASELLKVSENLNLPRPRAFIVTPRIYRLILAINHAGLVPVAMEDDGTVHYRHPPLSKEWETVLDEVPCYLHGLPVVVGDLRADIGVIHPPSISAMLISLAGSGKYYEHVSSLVDGIALSMKARYSGAHGNRENTKDQAEHGEAWGRGSRKVRGREEGGEHQEQQPEAAPDQAPSNRTPSHRKRPPVIPRRKKPDDPQ